MNTEHQIIRTNIRWQRWLPTPGNVTFTLLVVLSVLWTQNAAALTLFAATAPINIPYQARLKDSSNTPLTGDFKMSFRLYNTASASTPVWMEVYQDARKIRVTDGLFNVLLGSGTAINPNIITGNQDLYLGVAINDDVEMTPRIKLGTVPFAAYSANVPDISITTAKLADQSVTLAKLAADARFSLPTGAVIMWHGETSAIPADWQLCDGTNQTPDLRDRFIVGAGGEYAMGVTGGAAQVSLTVEQLPSHSHTGTTDISGAHKHDTRRGGTGGSGRFVDTTTGNYQWDSDLLRTTGDHQHTFTTDATGDGQPIDTLPPYYALALICKK